MLDFFTRTFIDGLKTVLILIGLFNASVRVRVLEHVLMKSGFKLFNQS